MKDVVFENDKLELWDMLILFAILHLSAYQDYNSHVGNKFPDFKELKVFTR